MTGPVDPDSTRSLGDEPDATLPAGQRAGGATADRTYVGGPPAGGGPPSDFYDDDGDSERRKLWWLAAGALAAGILVGAIIAVVASGGDNKEEATTTTSSSTSTSSTTITTLAPTTTTAPVQIPGQVLNLTAGPGGGSGEVSLQWDAVPGATSYRIYRSGSMGSSGALIATVNTNSYTDVPGVHSYYQVSAVNSAGEGQKSVEQCGAVVGDPC